MLSGRGLCDELIARPEESYRLCCCVVCDLETSRMGAPYIYDISRVRVNKHDTAGLVHDMLLIIKPFSSMGLQNDLINCLKPSGSYMCHLHNIQKLFAHAQYWCVPCDSYS